MNAEYTIKTMMEMRGMVEDRLQATCPEMAARLRGIVTLFCPPETDSDVWLGRFGVRLKDPEWVWGFDFAFREKDLNPGGEESLALTLDILCAETVRWFREKHPVQA